MFSQINIFLNPHLTPTVLILFLSYTLISLGAIFLIRKRMTKKTPLYILLIISVIFCGLILGGSAHPALPSQLFWNSLFNFSRAVLSEYDQILSFFYLMLLILGLFILSTFFVGRTFCGYACPLGAAQELVSRLNVKTGKKTARLVNFSDKVLIPLRLIFFISMIILAISWGVNLYNQINPLPGFNVIRNYLNIINLFFPLSLLLGTLILSIFIYRPFCRLICPFGTISWITSHFSLYKMNRNDKCTDCGKCEIVCPTSEAYRDSNKSECYLCNRCKEICPFDAIELTRKKTRR